MDLQEIAKLALLMGALESLTSSSSKSTRSGHCLQRFGGIMSGTWNVRGKSIDMVSFITDKDIDITALGLGNCMTVGGSAVINRLEIRKSRGSRGKLIYQHPTTLRMTNNGTEASKFVKVNLANSVRIKKHAVYTILVLYGAGNSIHSASGSVDNSEGGVTFKFLKTETEGDDDDNNANSKTSGPIRDIYFE